MSEMKKQKDRERLREKRRLETPEVREARLKAARIYKASKAGKKALQKYDAKHRAKSNENAEKVVAQAQSLEEQLAEVQTLSARLRGLLRDKQTLQMERFPAPIEHISNKAVKIEVSGRYAEVRFRLRDLADELEQGSANIALAVLKQQIPVIKDKIERLAND